MDRQKNASWKEERLVHSFRSFRFPITWSCCSRTVVRQDFLRWLGQVCKGGAAEFTVTMKG